MRRPWCWFLGLGMVAAGCGGPESKPPTQDDLKSIAMSDVASMYRMYTIERRKPPEKIADFAPMEAVCSTGLRAVREGEVVVRYGATLPDTGEEPGKGPGDEVLAYERQVPESGGRVLMLDRTVRTMTPDEFRAAKLAGDGSSAPVRAEAR